MTRGELIQERLTHSVIGAFFEAYNTLGFGFLEHLYVMALEHELLARGHRVAREVWVSVMYKGQELGKQRLDMVVDETLVIETKSTHDLPRVATRQLYNYLRATGLEVGLLLLRARATILLRDLTESPQQEITQIHPRYPFHPPHAYDPFVLDARRRKRHRTYPNFALRFPPAR